MSIDNTKAEQILKEVPHPVRLAFFTAAAAYAVQAADTDLILKFSGKLFNDSDALDEVLTAAYIEKQLGANVIVVHGGGDQISTRLDDMGVEKKELDGRRLCDKVTFDVSLEVLRQNNLTTTLRLNEIASEMRNLAYFRGSPEIFGKAEGAFNGGAVNASYLKTGYLTGIHPVAKGHKFTCYAGQDEIPVVYTICIGPDGKLVNVNADDVTEAIARAVRRESLNALSHERPRKTVAMFIGDSIGVLDENEQIIDSIFSDQIDFLLGDINGMDKEKAIVTGGMIPKLQSACGMAEDGIEVVILSADSVIEELMTVGGQGTRIRKREAGETNELDLRIAEESSKITRFMQLPESRLG